MKFLFWKYYVSVMLMAIISVAHADEMFSDEAFSYIVIKKLVYSPPPQTKHLGVQLLTPKRTGGSFSGHGRVTLHLKNPHHDFILSSIN